MLVSTSNWERGSARVATTLVLGHRNRTHIVRRRGLMFDTRFLVGAGTSRPCGTLHFLLDGELVLGSGARLQAPVAHALLEEEFDHRSSTAESFRLEGSPTVVIDILLPASSFLVPLGIGAGPCVCTDEVWAAARALAAATDDVDASYRAFVVAVRRARLVTDAVVSDANTAMPAHIERLWRTMAAFYRRQDTAGFLDAVAELSGLSLRQIARDWGALDRSFFLWGGFRTTLRVLRLRRATLLLSCAELSVGEVAKVVGYTSVDAMSRAFRDAGLPRPEMVREALLRAT